MAICQSACDLQSTSYGGLQQLCMRLESGQVLKDWPSDDNKLKIFTFEPSLILYTYF